MKILAVDTSTQYTFLAICVYQNRWSVEKIFCEKISREKDNWLELHIRNFCGNDEWNKIDGFASGRGPGSFTSLRINFTYLKTLAILQDKLFLTFSTSGFYRSLFCKSNEILLVQVNRNLYFACDPELPEKPENIRSLAEWTQYYLQGNPIIKKGNKNMPDNSGTTTLTSSNILLWNQYPILDGEMMAEFSEIDPQFLCPMENIVLEMPSPEYIIKNKKELMNSAPFYGQDVIINRKS